MRVALWGPLPPPAGGITRWMRNYLDAAAAAGIEADVIDTSPRAASSDPTSRLRPARVVRAGEALAALHRLLARRRPDVVHLCTTLFWATARDGPAVELCRRAGVPAVLHLRLSPQIIAWHRALPWPARQAVRAVLGRATAVITLSEELRCYVQALVPGGRVLRIANPVDTDVFHPAAAPRSPGQPLRVLFAGLVTPQKGVLELARAVLAVGGLTLALAGPRDAGGAAGPSRRLDEALAELERQGRLSLLGEVPEGAMPAVYRDADVFCLPSHGEGLPNALLEAMASGLPCVVTPVGAVPEVIQGEGGRVALLVAPRDEDALRGALRSLRDDPSLRAQLGEAARRRAVRRYASRTIMAEYAALYAQLAAADASRPEPRDEHHGCAGP
ncbi:glycosyltransferase [Sorangium cellulosum So ce56]|uniref:Glycosyltransferase n=1 Tax=Sorangium cellulosum (strain So ce56) TaxID=448385 RepID=A9EZR1_SORC5|nr:glycosyltransferase family 4 protein [Sorangium cellulosum]CAN91195.1 glycosyltransferase [Sorangium cellulosum So ce56]